MADPVQGVPASPFPAGRAVPKDPQVPQQPQASQALQAPQQPAAPQGQQLVDLNWSYKPEFFRKPDEHAEAHLIHTSDWMNAHHFIDGVKVQRFCLTLLGEARLW